MKNPLTSLAKRAVRLVRRPIVARRRGALFLLDSENWIDNRLIAGAHYENRQIEAARNLIAANTLDLIIDIGANIGVYTVLIGRDPAITDVLAFEPVRRNYAQLMANLYLNRLTGKTEVHRVGLGAAAADVTIHIDPRSTGLARLDLSGAERSKGVFTEMEPIRIARFDDVCRQTGRRAFVKIDVEGHATEVLSGMETFLKSNYAVLQIELQASERNQVIDALKRLGFELTQQIETDAYFTRPRATTT